jgi:hypothetical protein
MENTFKISDGSIGQIPYRYTNLKNIRTPKDNKIEVLKVSSKNKNLFLKFYLNRKI